jgi:GTP cyclohydrolase I
MIALSERQLNKDAFTLISQSPDLATTLDLRDRPLTEQQLHRFETYMAEIFAAYGMDRSASTADTPRRFLDALRESTSGYDGDPKLITVFDSEHSERSDARLNQIVEGPVEFHALCEHHALPFSGRAWLGYIAGDQILGLSKLTRLVRLYARRFTVQERMGQQIIDAMVDILQPQGVAVYLEANHLCMQMRGVKDADSQTVTTFWQGNYTTDASLRAEFLTLCRR